MLYYVYVFFFFLFYFFIFIKMVSHSRNPHTGAEFVSRHLKPILQSTFSKSPCTTQNWRQTKFIFALLIITVFHISFDVSTKYKYQTAKVAVAWNINRNEPGISVEFRLFCYCGHNSFPIIFTLRLFASIFHIPFFVQSFLSLHLITVCVCKCVCLVFFLYRKQYCITLYLTN